MLDIHEEMENVGGIGDEAIYPEDAIDEDELNEEFKLLELECENEECSKAKDDAREKQPDGVVSAKELDAQPTTRQHNEESNASNDVGHCIGHVFDDGRRRGHSSRVRSPS